MHLIWHSRRGRRRNHLWQIFGDRLRGVATAQPMISTRFVVLLRRCFCTPIYGCCIFRVRVCFPERGLASYYLYCQVCFRLSLATKLNLHATCHDSIYVRWKVSTRNVSNDRWPYRWLTVDVYVTCVWSRGYSQPLDQTEDIHSLASGQSVFIFVGIWLGQRL